MTAAPPTTCFRHPDRETGRHCTRCGRPACPDCLRQASVGSHCVECLKEAQPPVAQRLHGGGVLGQSMLATRAIIAITAVAYLYQQIEDGSTTRGIGRIFFDLSLYGPAVHHGEWWRLFTAALVHANLLHIGFNMFLLWQIGKLLEPGAGKLRFLLIYGVSVLAGSAGALIATPHTVVVGASGGVFGVAAAATLVLQRQGVRFWDTGFGPLLLINLVLGPFIFNNVSMGGHIGGLVGGALAAEAMMRARKIGHPVLGYIGAVAVGVAAVVVALAVAPAT
jgi:membrane associated rhomboid family serine protease